METKEFQPQPSIEEKFKNLPVGSNIQIPLSKINPTDVDDGKESMTDELIQVYQEKGSNRLFIYDGNHRFFQKEKDLYREFGKDAADKLIEVKKVINDKPW